MRTHRLSRSQLPPAYTTRLACAAALSVACGLTSGCRRPSVDPASHVVNQHVIKVGETIAPTALHCHDGIDRVIAGPGTQIVTFSTPNDCSACVPHLSGLEEVLEREHVRASSFFVSWAPPAETTSALAGYHAVTSRPVCFDIKGALWDRYNISHTPVTTVLRDGRIVYMHDMSLLRPEAQKTFIADLHQLGAY